MRSEHAGLQGILRKNTPSSMIRMHLNHKYYHLLLSKSHDGKNTRKEATMNWSSEERLTETNEAGIWRLLPDGGSNDSSSSSSSNSNVGSCCHWNCSGNILLVKLLCLIALSDWVSLALLSLDVHRVKNCFPRLLTLNLISPMLCLPSLRVS